MQAGPQVTRSVLWWPPHDKHASRIDAPEASDAVLPKSLWVWLLPQD